MKLVEILAKELKEWPVGCDVAVCDRDGEVRLLNTHCEFDFYPNTPVDQSDRINGFALVGSGGVSITKEMWEAEKAKLDKPVKPESFNPIYCRDRIKEIDTLVESLEEERVSLVQALEDEGFALVNAVLVSPRVPSAAPTEDISDWRNWKEGDLVECVSDVVESCERMTVGKLYSVNIDCGDMVIIDDDNDPMHSVVGSKRIKWHSRPTTVNH